MRIAIIALVSLGCASALWAAQEKEEAAGPADQPVYIDAVSSEKERSDLLQWLAETDVMIKSTEFRDNLSAISSDYTSVSFGKKTGTVSEILEILKLAPPYRYFRTPITLVGNQYNSTALTGHNGEKVGGILVTSMALGRQHFNRYRSNNLVERSCATNTLAHEMSHTITDHPQWAQAVFEDTGSGSPVGGAEPIATYLIGSVAQCTYLQNVKRIKKDDLRACVATFGDSEFNNGRCDQFGPNDPVQWPKKAPRP